MVSTDHFRHELLAQLGRAAQGGRIDVLINSGELSGTVPGGSSWANACCDVMQAEFGLGDTMLLDRTSGAGMTVRYLSVAAQRRLISKRTTPSKGTH